MLPHLVYGKRSVLLDIFIEAGISALCMYRSDGSEYEGYDHSQSENTFHVSIVEFDTKVRKRIEKTNLFSTFVTLITI